MEQIKKTDEANQLILDLGGLDQAQVRVLKSLNTLLLHLMSTESESDYFEASAELLKRCAQVLYTANFHQRHSRSSKISYATQALEFSIDQISDGHDGQKLMVFDN